MTKVYPIYTRVFHALFALSILCAYLSAEDDDNKLLFMIHLASGALALGLGFFRIIWGFMGTKYSRFSDFQFGLGAIKEYFLAIFFHTKEWVGHNPASSYSAVFMIVLAVLAGVSGIALVGAKNESGIFSFLYSYEFLEDPLEGLHAFFANVLMIVVLAHAGGVLFEHFFHKTQVAKSMLDGFKRVHGEAIKVNIFHHAFGVVWILTSIYLAYWVGTW